MITAVRAAALSGLVALFVGGVATTVVGIKAYAAGREKERLIAAQQIAALREEHQGQVDAANARTAELDRTLRTMKERADHAREKERAANRAALAAVVADRDRLRDELAAAAAGGLEASDDSVGACRDRAATLGRVLADALQAHAVCTDAAEENATGIRTLQRAWPVDSGVRSAVDSGHSLK